MRYDALKFELHAYMTAAQAMAMRMPFTALEGGPSLHEPASGPVLIERALAVLPNGRRLSILRGMCSAGASADFETCRLDAKRLHPRRHETIESVQEEMDAVASLPPIC